jgi:hypothetical protein
MGNNQGQSQPLNSIQRKLVNKLPGQSPTRHGTKPSKRLGVLLWLGQLIRSYKRGPREQLGECDGHQCWQ